MEVRPSLTFLPATPPTDPPAAAAECSTSDWPYAIEPSNMTQNIERIQYSQPQGNSGCGRSKRDENPMSSRNFASAPLPRGSILEYYRRRGIFASCPPLYPPASPLRK